MKKKNYIKQAKHIVIYYNSEKNPKDYKINPVAIPRPNQFDEVYRNADKQNIYYTNEETFPPYSTSYYIVNETQNSNPRFIRTTMTRIPTDQSVITNSSLTFGLYCQPFAELDENEKPVPKVEGMIY
jgi:protein transport protein SEC24